MKFGFFATLAAMRFLILAASMALAAGCGQKGPLYLSNQPPPGMKPAKDIYKPVPYPKKSQPGDADPAK